MERKRLVDLLKDEVDRMDEKQQKAFRGELKKRLPGFIRKAAQDARDNDRKENEECGR